MNAFLNGLHYGDSVAGRKLQGPNILDRLTFQISVFGMNGLGGKGLLFHMCVLRRRAPFSSAFFDLVRPPLARGHAGAGGGKHRSHGYILSSVARAHAAPGPGTQEAACGPC